MSMTVAEFETAELAKIDTRFYWFQGAWGEHQAVIVDTQTGHEYELMTRTHLQAPTYTVTPVAMESIETVARALAEGRMPRVNKMGSAGHFARQCFHRGLGYNPITL